MSFLINIKVSVLILSIYSEFCSKSAVVLLFQLITISTTHYSPQLIIILIVDIITVNEGDSDSPLRAHSAFLIENRNENKDTSLKRDIRTIDD